MSQFEAGALTLSMCTRCNDETNHVIVAMAGNQIVKVECKACGSIHKYRPPQKAVAAPKGPAVKKVRAGQSRESATAVGETAPRAKLSRTGSETRKTKTATPARKVAISGNDAGWEDSMRRLSVLEPKPYKMDGEFVQGDLISHPSFGMGEVLLLQKPDKMDALFKDGIKRLRCAC